MNETDLQWITLLRISPTDGTQMFVQIRFNPCARDIMYVRIPQRFHGKVYFPYEKIQSNKIRGRRICLNTER